ncbi:MAG TPA: glycosyl hydrolase [Chitinophagaceae bacterium]|nr:glycosyl hydrolase [Chitinophagaceae bacterium]
MKEVKLFLIILFFSPAAFAQDYPCDKKASPETIHLYNNLKKILSKGFMVGHQDDLAYGVNWKYENGNSDIKEVTGDYPAVYGWELGHLELDSSKNLDAVPFDKMKQFIATGYARGGVITISWHFTNALTGKSAWDATPGTVAAILPGGVKNDLYKSWLDKLAAFMLDLKGKAGEPIPVIFRPFHELNGSWFWWGKNFCTPEELKQLYRFTVGYLRDTRQVHNLLYAFNTDRFKDEEEYLERFPGDEWVDIIGFDIYQRGKDNEQFIRDMDKSLSTLEKLAAEKNKIAALTEFGYGTLPDSTWWTKALLPAIGMHKISYALAWRNAGKSPQGRYEYYVPFKGEASAPDFIKFYQNERTLFQKDVAKENLYK